MISTLFTRAMNTTPISAPGMLPLPPVRLAPPRMTAVMTRSSAPTPAFETAVPDPGGEAQPGGAGDQPHQREPEDLQPLDVDPREPGRLRVAADVVVLAEEPRVR